MEKTTIQLNPKFQPLWLERNKRYFVCTGGRGSGKSFTVSLYLCDLMKRESGHVILYSRYTMISAQISIIPEFEEKMELLGIRHEFKITKNEIIHLETGSRVIFRGIKTSSGNQTAKLKSIKGVTVFVLDEAEELESERDFDTIDLSIRQAGVHNKVILVLNPPTKEHWTYQRFFKGSLTYTQIDGYSVPMSTHTDVCHIHTTYLDNYGNLDESFLQQIYSIRDTRPDKYQYVVIGAYRDKAEGVIFENWQEGQFDYSLPYARGLDFGYSVDPTAMIRVAIDEDRKLIYLSEELYRTRMTREMITSELQSQGISVLDLIIADSAESRLIDELGIDGFNIVRCQKGPDSVRAGILQMQEYTLIVDPNSQNLKTELNNYVWHDKRANIPVDAYNHLLDAARYAVDNLALGDGILASG